MTSAKLEAEKAAAARAAAELVEDGTVVGLGTGSTVAHLLPALADRKLSIRCVATSPRTEDAARALGIEVDPFGTIDGFDIGIDGADQVAPDGWLVKGGGGAHTREKIVAAAAERFVVIADSTKPVEALHGPVPLELAPYGLRSTLRALGDVRIRDWPPSPDGGVIADYHGEVGDPVALAERFGAIPGVVQHGLFPPALTADALIARGESVEHLTYG